MSNTSASFHRDYLVRLPLPLAQLYSRAFNAKEARARHDNAFYLFESIIKLAAAPQIAAYLAEVKAGAPRVAPLDRLLAQLALPSLGQWVAMLRELARHFGQRADAASHPLGHVWGQLEPQRRDLPGILALYRRIKNGPDGEPAGNQSCSMLELLDALVQYRNGVFGHGASRFDAFYEHEMGPLLLPAASELLAEGVWDLLGPRGSRLVYLAEVRTVQEGRAEVGLMELVGRESERMAPLPLPASDAAGLAPNCVAVLWPGRPVPLRLDPLLVFRGSELTEEVLFLNRDRNGRQAEYLSYTTGRTERDRSMAPALAKLLSQVTGREIGEGELAKISEQSLAETPSVEMLFGPAPPAAEQVGDYEILAEIGRGGMGVVYLARQLSLGRLVALKMLPADLAADEVALARFRREMRALGRCEHPHIVKVLANGTLPDGRLYYTMEYVPGADLEMTWSELAGPNRHGAAATLGGTTWSRAVLTASRKQRDSTARHAAKSTAAGAASSAAAPSLVAEPASLTSILPPLPELPSVADDPGGYARRVAMLIRDAALALQTVHEQGIVHRDVKPANLLLTPDGQRIVLMDFGLAKGQSVSLSASKAGGLLGTLRYAAPEQLAAASLKVGPPADVRGLGVTLWELLTRQRLFIEAEDERQLASMVHDQDVPRLRSIDPSLDADLEAIVARATERRVADRIQAAAQLADYLQLYLDGKPLPIRPPSTAELLGRWVRGHKALVATAAAALAAILVTVTLAFISVTSAKNIAVAAKKEADDRNQLLLATLRSVVNDIEQKLHYVPRSADLRKSLLNTAIPLLQRVAGSLEAAPQADRTLLASHLDLGDVFLSAGADVGASATDSARRQYDAALTIALALYRADPTNSEARSDLGLAYASLAQVSQRQGKLPDAVKYNAQALDIRQRRADDEPQNLKAQRDLATSLGRQSDLDQAQANYQAALVEAQKAQDIFQRLAGNSPNDAAAQRDLALSCSSLGDAEYSVEDYPRAGQDYAQAIKIINGLAATDPHNLEYQTDLSSYQERLGEELEQTGDLAGAAASYQAALQAGQQLVQLDPMSIDGERNLAIVLRSIGSLALKLRNASSARTVFQQQLQIFQGLAQLDPANVSAQKDLSNAYSKLGDACYMQGDSTAARANYQQALGILQALAKVSPQDKTLQDELADAWSSLAGACWMQKDATAEQDYLQAVTIRQQLLDQTPQDVTLQGELAAACSNLGTVQYGLDELGAARDSLQREMLLRQQLAQTQPANVPLQTDLANTSYELGMVDEAGNNFPAASKSFMQAVALLTKLKDAGKQDQPASLSLLKFAQTQLTICNAAPQAIADLDFALKQPSDVQPELLAIRGRSLAGGGHPADAVATADKLASLDPKSGRNLYLAAGVYAICVHNSSGTVATAAADLQAQQERYAVQAVNLLTQAKAIGYFQAAPPRTALLYQHVFDPLRSRDAFKKLLAAIVPQPAPVSPAIPAAK